MPRADGPLSISSRTLMSPRAPNPFGSRSHCCEQPSRRVAADGGSIPDQNHRRSGGPIHRRRSTRRWTSVASLEGCIRLYAYRQKIKIINLILFYDHLLITQVPARPDLARRSPCSVPWTSWVLRLWASDWRVYRYRKKSYIWWHFQWEKLCANLQILINQSLPLFFLLRLLQNQPFQLVILIFHFFGTHAIVVEEVGLVCSELLVWRHHSHHRKHVCNHRSFNLQVQGTIRI